MSGPGVPVQIKFIFANHNERTVEASYDGGMTVSDVKSDLLLNHWPASFGPPESVFKLRMFHCGRELRDSMALKDYRIGVDSSYPAACHIFIVQRGSEKAEAARVTRCTCKIT